MVRSPAAQRGARLAGDIGMEAVKAAAPIVGNLGKFAMNTAFKVRRRNSQTGAPCTSSTTSTWFTGARHVIHRVVYRARYVIHRIVHQTSPNCAGHPKHFSLLSLLCCVCFITAPDTPTISLCLLTYLSGGCQRADSEAGEGEGGGGQGEAED